MSSFYHPEFRPPNKWTPDELALLKDRFDSVKNNPKMCETLWPEHTYASCRAKAYSKGWVQKSTRYTEGQKTCEKMLAALRRWGPLTSRDIMERTSLGPNAVEAALKRLARDRLVVKGPKVRSLATGYPAFIYRLPRQEFNLQAREAPVKAFARSGHRPDIAPETPAPKPLRETDPELWAKLEKTKGNPWGGLL